MSRPAASRGRTGRPPVTSRAQILTAARQLIDREGWEKLTIRRLAAKMGIGPTTLYHYVRDKEDLQLLLIAEYVEQIQLVDLPDDPRERIIAAAMAVHDALMAWPWAAEVMTIDGFLARLGKSGLELVEVIIAGAIDCGCTPDQAVYIVRDLWYYTIGEILVRAHTARRQPLDPETPIANLDPVDTPNLAAVSGRWLMLSRQNTYGRGLAAFVDGLLADFTR